MNPSPVLSAEQAAPQGRAASGNADSLAMPRTQKKRSLARVIVLMLVFTATILGLWIGASWLFYRLGNTVTRNATVKGRIHKIGARLDGQVKQIAVIPGQQVRKGELILQLEDEFYQANVRQAESELNVRVPQITIPEAGKARMTLMPIGLRKSC